MGALKDGKISLFYIYVKISNSLLNQKLCSSLEQQSRHNSYHTMKFDSCSWNSFLVIGYYNKGLWRLRTFYLFPLQCNSAASCGVQFIFLPCWDLWFTLTNGVKQIWQVSAIQGTLKVLSAHSCQFMFTIL